MADRLNYNEPPRFYLERASDPQVEAGLYAAPTYETCYLGMTRGESLLAAWSHYKAHNDPPGLTEIFRCGGLADGQVFRGWKFRFGIASDEVFRPDRQAARAAAWAWYDRRLALAGRAERERDGIYLVTNAEPLWTRCLAWSDRDADAVGAWLDDSVGVAPPVLFGGRIAALQRSLDEMRRLWSTTPGIYFDDRQDAALAWPRCLTWSDDQVTAVERWLVDSTAEMPEVLRG